MTVQFPVIPTDPLVKLYSSELARGPVASFLTLAQSRLSAQLQKLFRQRQMPMRIPIFIFLLLTVRAVVAQHDIAPTSSIRVFGAVSDAMVFHADAIAQDFPVHAAGDVILTNHKGEIRDTLRAVSGVRVRDLLGKMMITEEKAKEYGAYYFVFRATDGYTVVFSWNEIFNAPTGDYLLLVTEKDGKVLHEMEERILCLVTTDTQTGRRHIRALQEIEVMKAR